MTKLPAHEIVYRRLRSMILYGDLAPGQAVTLQGLVERLDVSMTPVREAIRRLTAEGALVFQGNRRVCVPELALDALEELAFARLALEPELAERAAHRITPGQIGELRRIDADLNDAIARGDVTSYLRCNHLFHVGLYGLAEAPVLLSIVQGLWLRMGPSQRIICGRIGTTNLPDLHDDALEALAGGRPAAVRAAMTGDIEQGLAQLRAALAPRSDLIKLH